MTMRVTIRNDDRGRKLKVETFDFDSTHTKGIRSALDTLEPGAEKALYIHDLRELRIIEGEPITVVAKDVQVEHVEQFFAYAHLPEHLQLVSAPFAILAQRIVDNLPRNQQRTIALNKLLEAKDAAVRALVAQG